MTSIGRVARVLALSTAVLILATGCTQAVVPETPSPSPSASATATVVPATPTPAPTATPTTAPTATPTPTPEPTPCPVVAEDGRAPSDRLLDVGFQSGGGVDTFTFHFGRNSIGSPAGPPTGEMSLAEPPYTEGPSGLPIDMDGQRVLQVVFRQMSLSSDTGDLVYKGPPEVRPDLQSLKHAVMYDQSEGVIGWYLGYDGTDCVTLTRAGNDVTVSFVHPAG
jgi:hypothetical protein